MKITKLALVLGLSSSLISPLAFANTDKQKGGKKEHHEKKHLDKKAEKKHHEKAKETNHPEHKKKHKKS